MKFLDSFLLGLSIALIIIGIHQTITHSTKSTAEGFQYSYGIFMFALAAFFIYQYRKNIRLAKEKEQQQNPKAGKKNAGKKR